MDKELTYGTSTIRYKLLYESRRTLRIEIHPDMSVWVKVPEGTDEALIIARLTRRATWIRKQQRYYQAVQPASGPKQYVSGESFRYLGYQHRLKVVEGQPEGVKRVGSRLLVLVSQRENESKIKKLVESWFRRRAQRIFSERLAICRLRFAGHITSEFGSNLPELKLLRMIGRWGSCTAGGQIALNPSLIQASTDCIDYVITHELAHLIQHNHSPAFYRLLNWAMPDWKARKQKLEETRWD